MFRRYPFIAQGDKSDCGPTALAMIAKYLGRPVSLHRIRDLTGTDAAGTNMTGLVIGARAIGFDAKAVECPVEHLSRLPVPSIAHIERTDGSGHYVVIYKVTDRKMVVGDPSDRVKTVARSDFEKSWKGFVLLVTPAIHATANHDNANIVKPVTRFVRLLELQSHLLIEGALCAFFITMLGVSTSFFIQHLVDSVLVRGERQLLNVLGIGMVLVLGFRIVFGWLREYLLANIGKRIDVAIVSSFVRHLVSLPLRFFEMRQVGDVVSRVNDAERVREAISGTALTAITDTFMISMSAILLWSYDAKLALVAFGFVPLLIGVVAIHHVAIKKGSLQIMQDEAKLASHVVEDVSAIETIKAFNLQQRRSEIGETRLCDMVQSAYRLQVLGIGMNGIGMFVAGLANISVLWFGGIRVMNGSITIGQLMFFVTLLGCLFEPLGRLVSANLQIQEAIVAIDRIHHVLDHEVEPQGSNHSIIPHDIQRGLIIHNVTFGYGCRGEVLRNINLVIPAGKTIAIVGESGSGKSTMLKLLLRFYDPTAGRILIDDVDYRDCDRFELRERIGFVSQDPYIFNGTLLDNITLGGSVDMERVLRVAKATMLADFVDGLPNRYDTRIGERGQNLSGGQRQRLAIARTLVREPEILIFDEATSHLDTETEQSIQHSLNSMLIGKTILLVAHRLSSVKDADLIYLMHHGEIVEQGSHFDLLHQGGRYAKLWRAQTNGGRGVVDSFGTHGSIQFGAMAGELS